MLRTRAGLGRVDAALKHATRRCPFLGANPGVLPPIEPKAAAPSVHPDALKLVASKCPVMAPVVHSPAFKLGTITQAVVQTAHNEVMTSFAVKGHQTCPGLNTPPVCPVTNTLQSPTSGKCPYAHSSDGALSAGTPPRKFDYDTKFAELITRKKEDASYRIFNTVRRNAEQHPVARYYKKDWADGSAPEMQQGSRDTPEVTVEDASPRDKDVEVWCSNDYLSMSMNDEMVRTVTDVLVKEGVGSGGTRNISGNNYHHEMLEKELADLHKKDAALIFTSCFVANDATLSSLGSLLPKCIFYSDASNHASMIQGIRNGRCEKRIFRHNDVAHLDDLLGMDDPATPKIVAFESVYSMCGTIAPIEQLCEVAHRHNALTFIDEVHAVGLYGDTGAGVAERDGLMDHVDIVSGTLAKAYGTLGGYIAGPRDLIDMVRSYAPGFVFTSSLPPMVAAGATKSIQLLKGDLGTSLRADHQRKSRRLIRMLEDVGIPVLPTQSHIVPVAVGDARVCKSISDTLLRDHDIYVQSINFPTVPRGTERLRITPGPRHTDEMMERFVDALAKVWEMHGLDFMPVGEDTPVDIRDVAVDVTSNEAMG